MAAPALPPLRPPGPAGPGSPESSFPLLCALLRDVRAEAQNLQRSLTGIRQKSALTESKTRTLEIQAAFAEANGILSRNRGQIEERLSDIRQLFRQEPQQYDWCGDEVTEIENDWERVVDGWPDLKRPVDETLRLIDAIDQYLDEIVFHTGSLTIPSRLDDHLKNLRVGQALDFHLAFEDELPKREQRQRVIDTLARQPRVVEGVVDAPNGLVYRASSSPWRRRASSAVIACAALAGLPLVWVFSQMGAWMSLSGWPVKPEEFPQLGVGYLFLMLGSLAHLVVNALKQSRSEAKRSFIALEDWLLWLHVREGSILWGILYLWVGFFLLAWSIGGIGWQTAFFAGYSIDSVVDLFLERFQKTATARISEIKGTA
jgi:hypothetical protein